MAGTPAAFASFKTSRVTADGVMMETEVCEGHVRAEGDAAVRCLLDGRLIWDMRG